MPFPNYAGKTKVWTQERVEVALKAAAEELQGVLPSSDRAWDAFKLGRYDLPPSVRVYEYYHSFPQAWLATGVDPERVDLSFAKWTNEDNEYLLENAGKLTLKAIAKHLGRTYPSTRARLNKWYGIKARHNQGYLSAADLSKEFNCPYHRIRTALTAGTIKGRFDKKRNRWQIDLVHLTSEALAILRQPKLKSYRNCQTDLGDYYQRYGLRRTMVNGRMVAVTA